MPLKQTCWYVIAKPPWFCYRFCNNSHVFRQWEEAKECTVAKHSKEETRATPLCSKSIHLFI